MMEIITIAGAAGGFYASLNAAGHYKIGTTMSLLDGTRRGLIRLVEGTVVFVDAIENRNTIGESMRLYITPFTT